MPLLQVRFVRQRGDARRPLRPPPQRHQREDLHLPVVLVHHPVRAHRAGAGLPGGHRRLPPGQGLPAQHAVPDRASGPPAHGGPEGVGRRLVPGLHARTEHRHRHLPRGAGRDGQEDDHRTQGGGMTRDVPLPPALCLSSITCL